MTSLCQRFRDDEDAADPNIVKVVTNSAGFALYFSRAPIPLVRNGAARRTPRARLNISACMCSVVNFS